MNISGRGNACIFFQLFRRWRSVAPAALTLFLCSLGATSANAVLMSISPSDFIAPKLITFNDFTWGTAIDGVSHAGITYGFTVGGTASSDAFIGDGAGSTQFISEPNIDGNADGVLSISNSFPVTQIGYGFAISRFGTTGETLPNVTSVELFDAADTSLGSLDGDAAAYSHEGIFTGFLGLESDIPFSRAEISWDFQPWSGDLHRFALDNLVLAPAPVPEPASLLLLALGLVGLGALGIKSRRSG